MRLLLLLLFGLLVPQAVLGQRLGWAAVDRLIEARFPGVPTVSTAELDRLLADDDAVLPVLLDARTPEEYAVSHLPGARRVDPDAAAEDVLAEIPPGLPVVVYCSVGYRSAGLADRLRDAGRDDVYNLAGSIFQWANEGRPVYRGTRRVDEVHPYDAVWGRLLEPQLRAQ